MLNRIHDIVPLSASSEQNQNSEPSVAVNPLNPYRTVAGAFLIGDDTTDLNPYYVSLNGGLTWTAYGALVHSDKTIAWKADGTAVLTAALTTGPNTVNVYSGVVGDSNFNSPGNPISRYTNNKIDQPWIEAGPSNHVYITYNVPEPDTAVNKGANVLVSTDGGKNFVNVPLDRGNVPPLVPSDLPAVRPDC